MAIKNNKIRTFLKRTLLYSSVLFNILITLIQHSKWHNVCNYVYVEVYVEKIIYYYINFLWKGGIFLIGVVIVTHGNLSKEILESAELIVGKQEKVITLTLNSGDNVEDLKEQVKESILKLDNGSGVLVLTDVFGGSPTNVTCFNIETLDFRAITGINMPMLLELFCYRNELELDELTEKVIVAGKEGIKDLHGSLGIQL